jgi:hypothetical protein
MIQIKLKYKIFAYITGILLFFFFISISVYGQDKNTLANDAVWVQKDLPQIIREALG